MTSRAGVGVLIFFLVGLPPAWTQDVPVDDSPELAYWEFGDGPATVVVLHGGPGATHSYLRPEWDRLADRYRVVYYDQRGCGESGSASSYHWSDHVRDLDRLLDEVAPAGPVALAGSSWGSHLAVLFAFRYPTRVDALVLSGVPAWPSPNSRPPPEALRRMPPSDSARYDSLLRGLPTAESIEATAIGPATHPEIYGFDSAAAVKAPKSCPEVLSATSGSFPTFPAIDSLQSIRTPAVVMHGTGAPIADGAHLLTKVLPEAGRVVIRGGGHDPWATKTASFFKEVEAFLADELTVSSQEGP